MTHTITRCSSLKRNPSLFASAIDDEMVMMDGSTGKYYAFNPVARSIWELLDSPKRCEEIVSSLVETYQVDRSRCENEIIPFLAELSKLGIIEVDACI